MTLDKSSVELSLNDFKSQDIFVFLKRDYKNNLLKKAISKAGSQSKLANLLKDNLYYHKMRQSTVSFLVKNHPS